MNFVTFSLCNLLTEGSELSYIYLPEVLPLVDEEIPKIILESCASLLKNNVRYTKFDVMNALNLAYSKDQALLKECQPFVDPTVSVSWESYPDYLNYLKKQRNKKKFKLSLLDAADKFINDLIDEDETASMMSDILEDYYQGIVLNYRALDKAQLDRVEQLELKKAVGEDITGTSCGFPGVDKAIGYLQPGNIIIIAGRPGTGKELRNDMPILLSNGEWERIDNLNIGDSLASIDGKESKVTGVFPQGKKHLFNITFSDGRSVVAGAEHQWHIICDRWKTNPERILTTAEIMKYMEASRYKNRLRIPIISGNFGEENTFPINPYTLGVLLGDGGMTTNRIKVTSSDDEILDNLIEDSNIGLVQESKYDWKLSLESNQEVKFNLKLLGLWGKKSEHKFIPDIYFTGTREQRLDLLNGLLDTDGTAGKYGAVCFYSSSKQLALDVQKLARSLGYVVTLTNKQTYFTYNGIKVKGLPSFTVFISSKNKKELFRLTRKKERVSKITSQSKRLTIQSIDYIGQDEATCISVSHPSELYITKDYIVTHNTAFLISSLMNKLATLNSDREFIYFVEGEMLEEEMVDRINSMIAKVNAQKFRFPTKIDDFVFEVIRNNLVSGCYLESTLLPPKQLHTQIKNLEFQTRKKCVAIYYDYIQLLTTDREKLATYSVEFKGVAKSLKVPVIIASQLNRDSDTKAVLAKNKLSDEARPGMENLSASGQIEMDADLAMALYKPAKYDSSLSKTYIELVMLKGRHTADSLFYFEMDKFQRFHQIDEARRAVLLKQSEAQQPQSIFRSK